MKMCGLPCLFVERICLNRATQADPLLQDFLDMQIPHRRSRPRSTPWPTLLVVHLAAAGVCWVPALSTQARAQSLPAAPDAGQLLQQTQPALPAPQPARPVLPAKVPSISPTLDATPVTVSDFAYSGNSVLSNAELDELLGDVKNRVVAFGQLRAAIERITTAYQVRGYLLARAVLPQQNFSAGQPLQIQILEGRLGQLRSSGSDAEKALTQSLVQSTFAAQGLNPGTPLQTAPLERSVLLVSDRLGVQGNTTLTAGQTLGSTDVIVNLPATSPAWQANISTDNYGNRYTGLWRASADAMLSLGNDRRIQRVERV